MTKTKILQQSNGVLLQRLALFGSKGELVFSSYRVISQRTPEEYSTKNLQAAQDQFFKEVGLCQASN